VKLRQFGGQKQVQLSAFVASFLALEHEASVFVHATK
jgi:hypothetical protein